jgi:hypothetical protein
MKKYKDEVDYSKGKPNAHCSLCKHYYDHECDLVQGYIQPQMWCKLFKLIGEE